MTGERPGRVPFQAHVELVRLFLAQRDRLVERIQEVLNAQRRPVEYLQDRPLLSRHFEDCFFTLPAITRDQARLRGQLQEAHRADGFRPSELPGMHNDLVDPAEAAIRGFQLWQQTRWPGRNGRVRYAHTLFNVYVIRCLELLSMRLWDAGPGAASDRLTQVQGVLDRLRETSPADQPVLVRDARWLIPLAQSPANEELAPYFEAAERIAGSLSEPDRVEIHKAGVQMAGGHLRSQLRHYGLTKGESLADNSLILRTRRTNALDFAMMVQGLVPLLQAYERAGDGGDRRNRLELAGAICQGISADPELFVNRVELLGAYSVIEHLFITADSDGHAAHTPTGRRHVRLLQEYATLIGALSKPLHEDCRHFRPVDGTYSPYGAIYGFSYNILEHMALKALQPGAATRFSLEDAFADGGVDKLAWVGGWRKLPHIKQEVQKLYDYPQKFAEDIFDRIEQALRRRAFEDGENAVVQTGRLFIVPGDDPEAASKTASVPDLPADCLVSSDPQILAAQQARSCDQAQFLHDRREGMFLVSYETPGGWAAISKDILTEVLGAGRDVKIVALPGAAAAALRLMCPGLVVLPPARAVP